MSEQPAHVDGCPSPSWARPETCGDCRWSRIFATMALREAKQERHRQNARAALNVLESQKARGAPEDSIVAMWAWRYALTQQGLAAGFTVDEMAETLSPVEIAPGETPCLGCGRGVAQPRNGRLAKWCKRRACQRARRDGTAGANDPREASAPIPQGDLFDPRRAA
jgi:hypothetical protein